MDEEQTRQSVAALRTEELLRRLEYSDEDVAHFWADAKLAAFSVELAKILARMNLNDAEVLSVFRQWERGEQIAPS